MKGFIKVPDQVGDDALFAVDTIAAVRIDDRGLTRIIFKGPDMDKELSDCQRVGATFQEVVEKIVAAQ